MAEGYQAMPYDEADRLSILRDYEILDTPEEEAFDEIVRLASRFFQVPTVLVSLVDEARLWFKARVGLAQRETPREWSFCSQAIRENAPLIVNDARADARFAAHPLVVGEPWIRFYCGVPVRSPEGAGLGTLCLLDRVPRSIDPDAVRALESLARLVEEVLELRRRLHLLEETSLPVAKEQRHALFTAMIVHDLRGPLSSINTLASLIEPRTPDSAQMLAELAEEAARMRALVADVLDLCLGELGVLRFRPEVMDLVATAGGAASRSRRLAARRAQRIEIVAAGSIYVWGDRALLDRVLANLLGNAIKHSTNGDSITVTVEQLAGGGARCAVADGGAPIPEAERARIFDPFVRLERPGDRPTVGYGLGLAFCRLAIARHGGEVHVEPGEGRGNRFVFELPAQPSALPPQGGVAH